MNRAELDSIITSTFETIVGLSGSKGEEYSNSADALANFKRNGERIGLDPLQIWHVYASKHYDSICTFIKDIATGKVRNTSEPIEGRIDDLILYLIILKGLKQDKENESKPKAING